MDAELMAWPEELTDIGRTIAESITVLGVVGYILLQLGGEIINIGPISFLKQLVSYGKYLFFFFNSGETIVL